MSKARWIVYLQREQDGTGIVEASSREEAMEKAENNEFKGTARWDEDSVNDKVYDAVREDE